MYTVEVYKKDGRRKTGERPVEGYDSTLTDKEVLEKEAKKKFPVAEGYRIEVHQTMVTRINMMSQQPYQEHYRTPLCCSPASETYWSM